MKALNYIRVVLVEPTHPGNIGATARAMANMGVKQLALVNPGEFPSPVATRRAAGADSILENAGVFRRLEDAIADCALVFGTTSRSRSIEWPSLEPWEAMSRAGEHARHSRVAILFGRESSGLTNEELDCCHCMVHIPASPEFGSLNLASAVMVMLYELRKALETGAGKITRVNPESRATARDLQHLYRHLNQVLNKIEFTSGRSTTLMRKIVRMFNRIHPYEQEVNILRGILSSIESSLENPLKKEEKR
ncbi:MAG: RNA methyltransferase [Gammaproteobacteria bacterium]|nr:RNA methyltransferase [Gammaproteobacteria bacterium]